MALLVLGAGAVLAGCGSRGDTLSSGQSEMTEARLLRTVYPSPPDELFGVRALAIDSTGSLYVLDSENFRIHVLRDERPVASGGSRGEGPGEFPTAPVYMDAADDGVLVTVGGANSRAAFYSRNAKYEASFSSQTVVLQAVLAPDGRVVATTLDSPTDPVLFDSSARRIRTYDLANDDNTIMDHFVMDAARTSDGRSLLAVAYHFRNRIQLLDLDTGNIDTEFSLDALPGMSDTRPNPTLDLFESGERPASVPAELPQTTMIQSVKLHGDRVYVHLRDHTPHRGREIRAFDLGGKYLRTILLPEPAFAIAFASGGRLYATADTATVVNLYSVE